MCMETTSKNASTCRHSPLPPCRPRISSWRTGGWGLCLWSPAGCWTRACSSSWWGCWTRPSRSRWCTVCSGRAAGRSPCLGLTWRWGQSALPPLSAHRMPAGSAALWYSTWRPDTPSISSTHRRLHQIQQNQYLKHSTSPDLHNLNRNMTRLLCVSVASQLVSAAPRWPEKVWTHV